MTGSGFRRSAGAAIAALVVAAGAGISVAPAAHAQGDKEKDDTFINFLKEKDVPFKNSIQAIKIAKKLCAEAKDRTISDWLAGYHAQQAGGWTDKELGIFVEGAVYTYCPSVWGVE